MKTQMKRKLGSGLIALAISQALLAGCASLRKDTPEEQAKLAKYEQKIMRHDGLVGH